MNNVYYYYFGCRCWRTQQQLECATPHYVCSSNWKLVVILLLVVYMHINWSTVFFPVLHSTCWNAYVSNTKKVYFNRRKFFNLFCSFLNNVNAVAFNSKCLRIIHFGWVQSYPLRLKLDTVFLILCKQLPILESTSFTMHNKITNKIKTEATFIYSRFSLSHARWMHKITWNRSVLTKTLSVC